MIRVLILGAALAGCSPQGHEARAELLKACRSGERSGEVCERALAGERDARAAARRTLYKEAL